MLDVFDVANLLVNHTKQAYGEKVAIVAYYGSYAAGTATVTSDLDMYYIPAEGEVLWDLYRSFVIDNLTFEYWPVSWEFAEKIASANHSWSVAPSLFINAKVLYSRTAEDLARFNALRSQIQDLLKPENKGTLVSRALETFQSVPLYLYNLQQACIANDLFATRWAGFKMITAIMDCLAMVNQTFFAKFWTSNLEPVAQLALKPDGCMNMIEIITTSGDLTLIQETAESLVAATRSLLFNEQRAIKQPNTINEIFGGFYAGIKEYVNKILSACEKRNMVAVSYDAAYLQSDMASMLAHAETGIRYSDFNIVSEYRQHFDQLQFPDLSAAIANGDFDAIKEQIQLFDKQAQEYFSCNSVDMNVMESMESLKAFIEKKP